MGKLVAVWAACCVGCLVLGFGCVPSSHHCTRTALAVAGRAGHVCVCARARARVCMRRMCVCVCVCVCAWACAGRSACVCGRMLAATLCVCVGRLVIV